MERTLKKYERRPPNPFFLFSDENRRKLIDENPGLGNKDISRILGTLWSQLESDKKQEFFRKAEELRAKCSKEFPGYKFSHSTTKRLKERQQKKVNICGHKYNSSKHLIIWRPTLLQIPPLTDTLPKQSVRPQVEPISEEKGNFFRYLGLCQRNSAEYFNIEAKLALNARKYVFTFIHKVRNRANTDKKDANKVKRPRGRPKTNSPKIDVKSNQVNKV